MRRYVTTSVLALIVGVLAVPSASAADTVEASTVLTGVVVNARDSLPIAHANVVLPEIRQGLLADENGRFEFRGLEPGTYSLRAIMVGCMPSQVEVVIQSGTVTECKVVLAEIQWLMSTQDALVESIGVDVDVSAEELPCELFPGKATFRVGDRAGFDVRIHNASKDTIWLVMSTEGSGYRARYPNVRITIVGPEGVWKTFQGGQCATIEDLSLADFGKLEPGEVFNPFGERWYGGNSGDGVFKSPGRYRVTFWYSTNEPDVRKWLGGFSSAAWVPDEMSRRLRRVPLVDLTCTIEVDVEK